MTNQNSNNFLNGKTITSFDPEKVWVEIENDKKIFNKKSITKEFFTINQVAQKISNKKININNNIFNIHVPEVYSWNEEKGVLSMEYCEGENLEFILRNEETYSYGALILNALLKFMLSNKFYWIDFAPRNILINQNTIYLVDFEKGLESENINFQDLLRNHVYEEYGSFLFLEDRLFTPDYVFTIREEEKNEFYYIKDIGPKRIKAVAKAFGYKEILTKEEYLAIIKMFIVAEEPIEVDGKFIFPRVQLEQILKDKKINPIAFDNYASEVIRINEEKNSNIKILKK